MKNFRKFLILLTLLSPLTASAADFTWVTNASGDISTAANWTGVVSPFTNGAASTGNIVISSGAPTYSTISLSGDAALSVSGITAITSGGNVTLSGTTSFTLGSASWKFGGSSTFTADDSAGTKTVTLQSGATLDTSAKDEGFVLVSGNNSTSTSPVGKMTIEAGATLTTRSAQLARGKGSNVTVDLYGTWTNTGNGRFSEFGSATINVKNGGLFNASGHLADQGAGTGTVNVEGGGTLSGAFASIGTRGRGIVNILDGGTWNLGDSTQTIVYGANGGARGTICQTGGTVSGFAIRFGSTDTTNGIYGGTGEYFLNGGTLTLNSSMYQQDAKASKEGAKNVTGTLYLGYSDASTTLNTGTGVASIKTMTNTLLKANAGTLYTTSFAQREGESTIQGSASVNIQDSLPTTLTAGTAGLRVSNANLKLTGTAKLNLKADATNSVNAYIGNTSLTLSDSAQFNMTNTAYSTKQDVQYFYLNGTNGSTTGSLTLNGSSSMTFDGSYFIAGTNDAKNPALITLNDSSVLTVSKTTSSGYFQLGGEYGKYAGHAKLVLNGNSRLVTSTSVQVAPKAGSTVQIDVNGNAEWSIAAGRVGDNGTLMVNLNGGKITASSFYTSDSSSGNTTFNVQGGTLKMSDVLTLATRGTTALNISDGTADVRVIWAGHIQGGTTQKVSVTQTGGTLKATDMILAQPNIQKIPTYTISGGSATISNNLYGFNIEYSGGELNVKNLYLAKTVESPISGFSDKKYVENTLNIELSDDYDASQFTIENLFGGTGTLNISAAKGYDFDPNANTKLFSLTNSASDLSQIRITTTIPGQNTGDWMFSLVDGTVILGTPNSLPEPATWSLLVLGLVFLLRSFRKH